MCVELVQRYLDVIIIARALGGRSLLHDQHHPLHVVRRQLVDAVDELGLFRIGQRVLRVCLLDIQLALDLLLCHGRA